MIHSQTHGESTGYQGHFAIKGFSDLTVRTRTCSQVAGWVTLYDSNVTCMLFYLSNLMWHKPISVKSIRLPLTSVLTLAGIKIAWTPDWNARFTLFPKWLWIVKLKDDPADSTWYCHLTQLKNDLQKLVAVITWTAFLTWLVIAEIACHSSFWNWLPTLNKIHV